MKILMAGLLDWGRPGAGRIHESELARAFRALGHEVAAVLPASGGGSGPAEPFVRLRRTPCFGDTPAGQWLTAVLHLARMLPVLRREAPDAFYFRFRACGPFHCALARRVRPRAQVISEHGNWADGLMTLSRDHARWASLARRSQVFAARTSDRVRALTPHLRDLLVGHGVPAGAVRVAGTGVDLRRFSPVPREQACRAAGLDPARRHVGFVGHLGRWQGVEVLLRAAARPAPGTPPYRVVVAGAGPQEAALRRLSAELGLADRALFLGAVAHARVPALIGAFDVAVGSLVAERDGGVSRSPMKTKEYAACGVPAIVTDEEAREHGGEAFCVVPSSDPGAVAESLGRLLRDDAGRAALGRAARDLAERAFSWGAVAGRILEGLDG